MKKILVALMLVLALSSVAFASELKTDGYVKFNTGDFKKDTATDVNETYRINFTWKVNDAVSAFIRLNGDPASAPVFNKYAIVWTPAGVPGKLTFGTKSIYGGLGNQLGSTAAFGVTDGIAFQSNAFSGVSGTGVVNFGDGTAPSTYALRGQYAAEIGTFGVNYLGTGGADKATWTVDATAPVPGVEKLSVYGEFGKKSDDTEVQWLGVQYDTFATLALEYDLKAKTTALYASKDLGGVIASGYYEIHEKSADSIYGGCLEVDF